MSKEIENDNYPKFLQNFPKCVDNFFAHKQKNVPYHVCFQKIVRSLLWIFISHTYTITSLLKIYNLATNFVPIRRQSISSQNGLN